MAKETWTIKIILHTTDGEYIVTKIIIKRVTNTHLKIWSYYSHDIIKINGK